MRTIVGFFGLMPYGLKHILLKKRVQISRAEVKGLQRKEGIREVLLKKI